MQHSGPIKLFSIITSLILFFFSMSGYADQPNSDYAEGAHLWANNCARCHNLRSPSEFTPEQWHTIMLHMRIQGGLMGQDARKIYAFLTAQSASTQASTQSSPTETTTVTETKTTKSNTKKSAATNSAKSTAKTPAKPAEQKTSQSGSVIYHQTCVVCHGANGKGAVPGAPDFTSSSGPLSKSDALLLQHIENGFQSPGSPMAMPARGGNAKLSNEDLKNTLNYIRSTFSK